MITYYKLIGRLAVPCDDVVEWGHWFAKANRHVAKTTVGPLWVSTVFLGIDHNFSGHGAPVLFETMIFDGGDDGYQVRASTWDAAQKCHAVAVEIARGQLAAAENMLKLKETKE